jgi:RimJ/RimL family protein N-acetyltransferase
VIDARGYDGGMAHPTWPLFDLRLRTARLEMRLPTDDEIGRLAAVALAGIHPVGEMPFASPWSIMPAPAFERGFIQHHWAARADWRPENWHLALVAFQDGAPVGTQSLYARDFARVRMVHSGSWLGRDHQGHGLGTEMRAALLALSFEGLGAEVAETEAFLDNAASLGVSRRLGYEDNGIGRLSPEGTPRDVQRFRLTAERWRTIDRPAVSIEGLDSSLEMFGVPAAPES